MHSRPLTLSHFIREGRGIHLIDMTMFYTQTEDQR